MGEDEEALLYPPEGGAPAAREDEAPPPESLPKKREPPAVTTLAHTGVGPKSAPPKWKGKPPREQVEDEENADEVAVPKEVALGAPPKGTPPPKRTMAKL